MDSVFRTTEISDPQYEWDGLRYLTVKSQHLKGRGDVVLYLPDQLTDDIPVVTLLHGVYGSAWAWALKGGAHKVADKLISDKTIKPMVLAMPSDGLWGDGSAYFSHHKKHFESIAILFYH